MLKTTLLTCGKILLAGLTIASALTGCTTYTWPDGSQETVVGVVPQDDNQRYEEPRAEGVRYRHPDDLPPANGE